MGGTDPYHVKWAISSSAHLITVSGNNVGMCSGAVLKAARVSGLIPVFRWFRYASLRPKVGLPMEMKTKSVRCSIVLAAS